MTTRDGLRRARAAERAFCLECRGGDDRDGGGTRLYAPVTNRGEAIGLIELHLADAPDDLVAPFEGVTCFDHHRSHDVEE